MRSVYKYAILPINEIATGESSMFSTCVFDMSHFAISNGMPCLPRLSVVKRCSK